MGKPAARVTDMLSDTGMITGPGSLNVLINGLPSARVGDNHVTSMVIPATPPLPLVGGPIVGPGCPTVLIGGMPASVMGDMAVTAGPPGTIVTCSPNVLIGSNSVVIKKQFKNLSVQQKIMDALSTEKVKPVFGSEAFPIEVQAVLLESANLLSAGSVKNALNERNKTEEKERLFISDFAGQLKEIEKSQGYEAARFAAGGLDFSMLCAMTRLYVLGIDTDPRNDPALMPGRFMLLYGIDDLKVKEADDHPDSFDGCPEHKITVANLRKGLKLLGYEVDKSGPFDDRVYGALRKYIRSLRNERTGSQVIYTVQHGDSLGKIASRFNLASWKYLYQINKEDIGDNPDMLREGIELKLPDWKSSHIAKMLKSKGNNLEIWSGGIHYRYPWVVLSVTIVNRDGSLQTEKDGTGNLTTKFSECKNWVIRDSKTGGELVSGSLGASDELETLVPNSQDSKLEMDGMVCHLGPWGM